MNKNMLDKQDEQDIIQRLIRLYYNGSLKFDLKANEINIITLVEQHKLLEATVHNSLIKKYPVNSEFSRLFFKKLLSFLEKAGQEVHDDLYIHLCNLMNSSIEDNVFRYRHYVVGDDLNNTITIKETNNVVVNGTTGMRTWEAAFMLGDWALCNKELFRDKRVLELGSGVGFTGIVISKFCEPREFIMTDCHNDVLKTICENIKINFSKMEMMENNEYTSFINEKCALGTMYLDWNDMKNISLRYKSPDIIIGADIVYDPSILIPLCRVIQTFAQRNKKIEVYIASVIRNETTFQQFLSTLESTGLVYEKIQQEKSVVIEWDNAIQRCLLKIKLP